MTPASGFWGQSILITGADGSVGQALLGAFEGYNVVATDVDDYDVRLPAPEALLEFNPGLVIHLAAAKHAPQGELDPLEVARTNVIGTANVLADFPDAKVVLTSTCKAADPETAYGASKLIAERMVLNAGGTVARLYNVIEASGNVFETWASLPADEPLPVTPCTRYFISMAEAVDLVVRCASLPSGRYTMDPGAARAMESVAREHYPGRQTVFVPPRRGDRLHEVLLGGSERFEWAQDDGLRKIVSPHDPVPVAEAVAA